MKTIFFSLFTVLSLNAFATGGSDIGSVGKVEVMQILAADQNNEIVCSGYNGKLGITINSQGEVVGGGVQYSGLLTYPKHLRDAPCSLSEEIVSCKFDSRRSLTLDLANIQVYKIDGEVTYSIPGTITLARDFVSETEKLTCKVLF